MIHDPDNIIVHAHIYSWQGMSLGAIHYYCELYCGGKTVKAKAPLTAKHAAYLNKENRRRGFSGARHHPGDDYDGFLEYDEALQAALAYKNQFPQARCLLLGRHIVIEAFPVLDLDGPDEVKARLNQIAEKAKPLSCEEQEPFTDQWEQLLAETLGLEWSAWF